MKIDNHLLSRPFCTVGDLQHMMGIGRNTAYSLVKSPDFPSIRVSGRIVIPTDLLLGWIQKQASGGDMVGNTQK